MVNGDFNAVKFLTIYNSSVIFTYVRVCDMYGDGTLNDWWYMCL